MIHAVSPVSAFSSAGAAGASCAATSCTLSAVHPAAMTRQIRRTGTIFFILLIADSIGCILSSPGQDEVFFDLRHHVLSGSQWLSHATFSAAVGTSPPSEQILLLFLSAEPVVGL